MGIPHRAVSSPSVYADHAIADQKTIPTQATVVATDEQQSQYSEQEYRRLFETSPIAYALTEENGTVVRANESFRKEFFCPVTTDGSLINLWQKLVPDTEALASANNRWQQRVLTMQSTGLPADPFEETVSRYDGAARSVIVSCVPLSGRQKGRFFVALQDITDRKNSERQIEDLSQRLLGTAEQEREWVARELHETIGQELSVLKLMLQQSDDPAMQNAGRSIDEVLTSLRLMSGVLRPPVLELLGLEAALEELLARFSEYREIRYRLKFMPPLRTVSAVEKIGLYRIAEQCLYAIPHALKEPEVIISLRQAAGTIEMLIRIEGAGSTQIVPLLDEVLLRQRANALSGSLVTRFSEIWSEIFVKTGKNNQRC